MTDLFSFLRATLKAESYFTDYKHERGFKCYREGEAPVLSSRFITVDIQDGPVDQRTGWATPFVTFNVHGDPTEWTDMCEDANKIDEVLRGAEITASVDGVTVKYTVVGSPIFDRGENPVTGKKVRSVALRFGVVV